MRFPIVALVVLIAYVSAQGMGTDDPATMVPSTQGKGTTKATTTLAPTTKAVTTGPPTIKPATTAPPTTKPATTVPPTTKPATTVPPTTAPHNGTTPSAGKTTQHTTPGNSTAGPTMGPTTQGPTTSPPTTWRVQDCLVAQFDLTFTGTYELRNDTNDTFIFPLPENAAVDTTKSSCGSATKPAILALTFNNDFFILQFTKAGNMYKLSSASASFTLEPPHFPDSKNKVGKYGGSVSGDFFSANVENSFKCVSEEVIAFEKDDFKLQFSHLKVQPFAKKGKFGNEHVCFADDPAHWFLTDDKGKVCLVANFDLEFSGTYETTDKKQKVKPFHFNLAQDATVDKAKSKCAPTKLGDTATEEATLTLTTVGGDTFIQVFTADTKKKSYSLTKATAMLKHTGANFPDSTMQDKVVTYGGTVPHGVLQADLGSYFKCNANENVVFKEKDKNKFELSYSDTKIQPFDVNGKLGKMSECKADTPTVKPAKPPVGNWNVTNEKGICMLMDFGAEFFISYNMSNKTAAKVGFYFPNDTKMVQIYESTCTNTVAIFKAVFSPHKTDTLTPWVMTMKFTMNKEKMYKMTNFSLKYTEEPEYFPGVNGTHTTTVKNNTGYFEAPSGSFFLCSVQQSFNASQVEVAFTDVKFQPFVQTVAKKNFGTEHVCFADDPAHWFLKDDKGKVCLVADFDLEFSGTYDTTDKKQKVKPFHFNLAQDATVDEAKSKCAPTKLGDTATEEAMLTLTTVGGDTFIQVFTADTQKKSYSLTNATAMLNHTGANFPNSTMQDKVVTYGGTVPHAALQADLGSYFNCNGSENVMFNDNKFDLNYSETKIQPFDVNGKLGKKHVCFADDPAHWFLKDDKGKVCLVADFDLEFSGMYETTDKKQKVKPFHFNLAQDATVDEAKSKCAPTKLGDTATEEAMLTLTTVGGDTFIQVFTADTKKKSYSLTNATAMLKHTGANFPDSTMQDKVVTYGGTVPHGVLQADLGSYFKCNANENVVFKEKDKKFELSYSDTQIQPFDVNGKLGKMSECKADTPTIKPSKPPVGNWNVSNEKGICMMMDFGAEFFISYNMSNKTAAKVGFYFPNDAKMVQIQASTCNNTVAIFKASFSPYKTDTLTPWVMTMKFTMNKKMYKMTNFSLKYTEDPDYFPGVNGTKTTTVKNNTGYFEAPLGSFFLCSVQQSFNASQVEVAFTDVKFQPFVQTVAKKNFGTAHECSADNDVSNIVPIAVGCALAGLVIIVLIAYLIGRSRTNRSGYQSV